MGHETEDAQSVIDGHQHDIPGRPLLRVKLGLRAPAFPITAAVDPDSHRSLAVHLTRILGPYIQIKAVLAALLFLAVSPLREVIAGIMHCLITGMAELIGLQNALPRLDRLRFFPTQLSNRRRGVRDSPINENTVQIGFDTLDLSPFNGQDRADGFRTVAGGKGQCKEDNADGSFHFIDSVISCQNKLSTPRIPRIRSRCSRRGYGPQGSREGRTVERCRCRCRRSRGGCAAWHHPGIHS